MSLTIFQEFRYRRDHTYRFPKSRLEVLANLGCHQRDFPARDLFVLPRNFDAHARGLGHVLQI